MGSRHGHFMEVVNLINFHSEMRYKISCQKTEGVGRENNRNSWFRTGLKDHIGIVPM